MNLRNLNNLFIDKLSLEAALGIKIDLNEVKTAAIPDFLKHYNARITFDDKEAAALLQGQNPADYYPKSDPNYYAIFKSLFDAIESGILPKSKAICDGINQPELQLDRGELEQWAKEYGYQWNLPPYQPLTLNLEQATDTALLQTQIIALEQQLAETQAENERLRAEIEQLKADCEKATIYGHTTTEIDAIFAVVKRYWINADLEDVDTIPNATDIVEWIRQTYPAISQVNADAIQKITRPQKAKNIGRKPS